MKRKLLFGERMLFGDGTEPFNIVIPFRLKGTFVLKDIQHALDKLQTKHPWLKAVIKHDETNIPWFEVSEKAKIPIRILAKKEENDWLEESKKEWYKMFNYKEQPLMRFVWIKGEETSDIIFVFHHCLCDGCSAIAVLDEFLKSLDNPNCDIGTENPIMGIQGVIPSKILSSFGQQFKAKTIGRLAAIAIKLIPVKKKTPDRQSDYLLNWKFDKETSKKLRTYCKFQKVTVNTFLCLVLLNAFEKIRKEKAFNKISCPIDIRHFANNIKTDNIFAFGSIITVSFNKKLGFEENLKLIQKSVKKKISNLNPYITMMVMESAHDILTKFSKLLKNRKSSSDCMFSNLGHIPIAYEYKNFTVESLSPSLFGPLGNTTTIITSIFQSEMGFSFMGSEGYLPYSDALAIRDELFKIIKQQLEYLDIS